MFLPSNIYILTTQDAYMHQLYVTVKLFFNFGTYICSGLILVWYINTRCSSRKKRKESRRRKVPKYCVCIAVLLNLNIKYKLRPTERKINVDILPIEFSSFRKKTLSFAIYKNKLITL